MFNIGDHIVYPMYGAGIITEVVEKDCAAPSENALPAVTKLSRFLRSSRSMTQFTVLESQTLKRWRGSHCF